MNPLSSALSISTPHISFGFTIDILAFSFCLAFIIYSLFYHHERAARPSFMLAAASCVFYQLPLILFSPLFYSNLTNATLFSASIHLSVIANLLWVYSTPNLNNNFSRNYSFYSAEYFFGKVFWLPVLLFTLLVIIYLNKIPFNCTALYALFFDSELTLLVREITGKLLGISYAPHVLNLLTSAVCPIIAFLLIGRIYYECRRGTYRFLPIWGILLILVLVTPLLGGAKGSLVPMAVSLAIAGFLVSKNWKYKLLVPLFVMVAFSIAIFAVKIVQENSSEKGRYQFAACIVRLNACERTKNLLESLQLPKPYYGTSKARISDLQNELSLLCDGISKTSHPPTDSINKSSKISFVEHLHGLLYRILVNPIQVVAWHFLYVSEHGAPGFSGISIAKLFSQNYVSVPARVCELYYAGDKTSACTAPTSYLFTYPAYLGLTGLLLAGLLSLSFDIVFSLLIKYSTKTLSVLAVGIMSVAVVNLLVSDFITVMVSHGTGFATIILVAMEWYARKRIGRR